MWPSWNPERQRLAAALRHHSKYVCPLPGISDPLAFNTLVEQLIASLRRESYYKRVQERAVSPRRADPNNASFDAERAVTYHIQNGNADEAVWLLFLMTHFGRPADTGWTRLKDVYGKLGSGIWDWRSVSANPHAFSAWLATNWQHIRGKFGNHRKYESLRTNSNRGTAKVIESYVNWIGPHGHVAYFSNVVHQTGNDPHAIFDALYKKLKVTSFGRLAKFDYLSLLGRYNVTPIDAGSAYLHGATGPLRGARLLFDGSPNGASSIQSIQPKLDALDTNLNVTMKVLEDALCNWQKSPRHFVHFKG